MMNSMFVTTPLMTNLEKLCDSTSNLDSVDPMMNRKWIGSLMFSFLRVPIYSSWLR